MLSSITVKDMLKRKRISKRKLEDEEKSDAGISDCDFEESSKPAKKKIRVSNFILDEAKFFDDDDDDDEASDDDEEESDFVANDNVEEEGHTARDVEGQKRHEGQINESELLQHLEDKYSKPENNVDVDDENEEVMKLNEASGLPKSSDPYFWLVKCRLGSELETVLLLTRKCLNSGLNLQVTSIVLPEGTKGWIFVEAHKEGHVRQLIEGVSALAYDNKEIRFIPKHEMPNVMKSTTESAMLRPKQFVRTAVGELQTFKSNVEPLSQISNLEIGDNVEVINHAVAGLKGRIIKKIGLTITIRSKSSEIIDFRQEELKKYFNIGDQVKVLRGVHQGKTGMVVRSENDVVIFISDDNMSEIRISSKDVHLSGDVVHAVESKGNFNGSTIFSNKQKNNSSDRYKHAQVALGDNPGGKGGIRGWKGVGLRRKIPVSSSFKRSDNNQKIDLIGKVVKVVRGNYKSYIGCVKKASDELAVLQLFTDGKIISIPTECLSLIEKKPQASVSASKVIPKMKP